MSVISVIFVIAIALVILIISAESFKNSKKSDLIQARTQSHLLCHQRQVGAAHFNHYTTDPHSFNCSLTIYTHSFLPNTIFNQLRHAFYCVLQSRMLTLEALRPEIGCILSYFNGDGYIITTYINSLSLSVCLLSIIKMHLLYSSKLPLLKVKYPS